MSDGVAIVVPVLGRPDNVAPLLQSIEQATPAAHRVLFVCDPDDEAELRAIEAAGAAMIAPGGRYSSKIRVGIAATDEPLIFLGADDLAFQPGWLEATATHLAAGAHVVGVNDGMRRPRRPRHATHFLITRDYAHEPCIDGSPGPLSDAYRHNFVDDELIATATARGVYAYAAHARVEHHHWLNRRAVDDDTYRRGREAFSRDRSTFRRRSQLWA